ncbi:hypothetical protein [Asanoa siamensis]|uniref:DUF4304 domain-containing protein n=1 Tax=Asanoa siamensis TaxID=926357 RepID=A0ABQ4D0Y0_9ACTN|nr:hypothetical protein [Asanoa siamensis]GIF76762.1 hypothetical protein Asi02nite_62800 [Asanoa siamensis]
MNALLRRFVGLVEADARAAGFTRRGPVFRYFDAGGDGIAFDIQRTVALRAEVAFFVNVGVLLGPHLRYYLGRKDPHRHAMPHHSVWHYRLVATDDTAELPDHTFELSTDADADRAATVVRTWLATNLPRMKTWLGDADAMIEAVEHHREEFARAHAARLADPRREAGRFPQGRWHDRAIRAYAHAQRGDVAAAGAETATWNGGEELAADVLALADRRRTELKG